MPVGKLPLNSFHVQQMPSPWTCCNILDIQYEGTHEYVIPHKLFQTRAHHCRHPQFYNCVDTFDHSLDAMRRSTWGFISKLACCRMRYTVALIQNFNDIEPCCVLNVRPGQFIAKFDARVTRHMSVGIIYRHVPFCRLSRRGGGVGFRS